MARQSKPAKSVWGLPCKRKIKIKVISGQLGLTAPMLAASDKMCLREPSVPHVPHEDVSTIEAAICGQALGTAKRNNDGTWPANV